MSDSSPVDVIVSAGSLASSLPPSIPDHELIRRIGTGSYGEVWLARSAVGTYRAAKIVYRRSFENERPFDREFRGIQKFEPISRSHEGLVDVLQIGRNEKDGYFYYIMELADAAEGIRKGEGRMKKPEGSQSAASHSSFSILHSALEHYAPRTLRAEQRCQGRLPLDECVSIGLTLASALEHLHKSGLVHRDIKPSNIIFVSGVPKLADIGLVADTSEAKSFVGTVGFIPPEGPGTPQADLYSLGKVLYEISTGKDRQDFPQLPADLRELPTADAMIEFNEILLRACESEPRRRYQSARQMRADLELLQRGESVKQKRTSERRRGVVKKISIAAALLALTAVALTTLVREISLHTPNASNRRSKIPLANKEYDEGVRCASRDTNEGLAKAFDHFNRAIGIDPTFTMAYNGLFEVYNGGGQLGLSRAEIEAGFRGTASKLMELDPKLAEAQAAQAFIDFMDWKWAKAEPRFRQAIRLNPKCAIAHMRYGFCLVYAGRPDEGSKELSIAEMFDPQLPRIKKNMGHVFYVKRQFREAIAQYEKAIELEPSYPRAHWYIGCAYRALDDYTNAIDEFEKCEIMNGKDRGQVKKHFDEDRRAYAEGGPRGYWLKHLGEAQKAGDLYSQARCHAKLNEYDQALNLLGTVNATFGEESLESLFWDECWDAVHNDPRFIALLKKAGLKK